MIAATETVHHRLRRWIAAAAVLLILILGVVEPAHVHSGSMQSAAKTPCMVCVLGHSTAPAATVHLLSLSRCDQSPAAMLFTATFYPGNFRQPFIRPPPSA